MYCSQKCVGCDFDKEKGAWILRYGESSVFMEYFSDLSRSMREMYCPLLERVSKTVQERKEEATWLQPSGESCLWGSFNDVTQVSHLSVAQEEQK